MRVWFVMLGAAACRPVTDGAPGDSRRATTDDDSGVVTPVDDSGGSGDSSDSDDTSTVPCEELTWYRDADGDGFGDPATTVLECTAPEGFVADATDCDDLHPAAYTGAAEKGTDGVDNDCDGVTAIAPVADVPIWQAIGSNDAALLGNVSATGDFDGDGTTDLVLGGVKGVLDGATPGGSAWIFAGPFSPGTTPASEADAFASFHAASTAQASSVCALGDIDGDGMDDLFVGTPASGGHNEGIALIARGPVEGATDLTIDAATLFGSAWGEGLGLCAGPGDVDGDGIPDVVISAYGTTNSEAADGSVYVLRGPADVESVAEAEQVLQGEEEYEKIGYSLSSLGDLNGDGTRDYGVGNFYNGVLSDGLATYLVTDYVPGVMHPRDVGVTLHYDLASDTRILTASRIDDINGDGYADVAFSSGDFYTGLRNNVSIVEGPFGSETSLELSTDADITFQSSVGGAELALSAVTTLGDWNGDGHGAIAIGAPTFARVETMECSETPSRCQDGAVFIVAAPIDRGWYDLAISADRVLGSYDAGQLGGGAWGGGLTGGTDLDGDGAPDLVFAAPFASSGDDTNAGSAYILFGSGTP